MEYILNQLLSLNHVRNDRGLFAVGTECMQRKATVVSTGESGTHLCAGR